MSAAVLTDLGPLRDSRVNPLAPAATMRLRAVRDHGQVVDFVWEVASDQAAALLRCSAAVLRGRYLCAWRDAGPPEQPRLIEHYRRILDHGRTASFDHVHQVDGRMDTVIHRVRPDGDGVAVTLINLSANRRAQAFRLRVEATPAQHHADRR